MPDKANYPDWFSPKSAPYYKPVKPYPQTTEHVEVHQSNVDNYGSIELTDEMRAADHIDFKIKECQYNSGSDEVCVTFVKVRTFDTPDFEAKLTQWEKDMAAFYSNQKAWPELKAKWDREAEAEKTTEDWATYQKLRAKFEGAK